RATWRQFAAAKAADEAQLSEYEALLREYPNDPDAAAQADRLRKKLLAHRELDLGGGVKLRLVEIAIPPPGKTFRIGSPSEAPDRREDYEGPWERARPRGYLLGQPEVTVGQFRRFVQEARYVPEGLGRSPPLDWEAPGLKERQTDEHPVVCVTWSDAAA